MPRHFFGPSVAIFVLFFGMSLLESLVHGRFTAAVLWALFGTLFITADIRHAGRRRKVRHE